MEHIRKLKGFATLKDWHAALMRRRGDSDSFRVSYASVRMYHYNREASASYLARVTEVFPDVQLEYLIHGRGEPIEVLRRQSPSNPVHSAIAEYFPAFAYGSKPARRAVMDAWYRLSMRRTADDREFLMTAGRAGPHEEWPSDLIDRAQLLDLEVGAEVGRVFQGVLDEVAVDVRALTPSQFEDYSRAVSWAIAVLFPEPKEFASTMGAVMPEEG